MIISDPHLTLEQLRDRRQRLAPDAATNAAAAAELDEIEHAIEDCERTIERSLLASAELERRDEESALARIEELRREASERAEQLVARAAELEARMDRSLGQFGKAVAEYIRVMRDLRETLKVAGDRQLADAAMYAHQGLTWRSLLAIGHALDGARVPIYVLRNMKAGEKSMRRGEQAQAMVDTNPIEWRRARAARW